MTLNLLTYGQDPMFPMHQMQMPAQTPHVLYQSAMPPSPDFVENDIDMKSAHKKRD